MRARTRNPQGDTFACPPGYRDLGWQLTRENPDLAKCIEAKHTRKTFDNSTYLYRSTDRVYICDECKTVYHIDSSD